MNQKYRLKGRQEKKGIAAFLLLPVIAYSIFCLLPTLVTLVYSLFKWNGLSSDVEFVGIRNYIAPVSYTHLVFCG